MQILGRGSTRWAGQGLGWLWEQVVILGEHMGFISGGEQMGFISVLPVFGVGFGVPTAYLGFCQLGQRLL